MISALWSGSYYFIIIFNLSDPETQSLFSPSLTIGIVSVPLSVLQFSESFSLIISFQFSTYLLSGPFFWIGGYTWWCSGATLGTIIVCSQEILHVGDVRTQSSYTQSYICKDIAKDMQRYYMQRFELYLWHECMDLFLLVVIRIWCQWYSGFLTLCSGIILGSS